MTDSTHIRIDKDTLGKLKALAGDKPVADLLREFVNGNRPSLEGLTLKDIAIYIGASQTAILKRLGELENVIRG